MIDSLVLARALHFAATVLAAGTVAFLVLVADRSNPPAGFGGLRRRLILSAALALALTILSGIVWLLWVSADMYGAPVIEVCLQGGIWTVLGETRFGLMWSARLAVAVLLGASLAWPRARIVQLSAASALLALLAPMGHAGATPGPRGALHVAGDMTHLLAAGAWLGALPAFAALLGAAQRRDEAWRLFAVTATCRFAQIALLSVAVLTASGLLNAWNLIDRPSVLLATDYGRLLLLKLGLFAAMLAIAAVNRFHLTPQVPAPAATRALQRNSIGEIVLGFGVLLLVALLGTLSPNEHLHGTTQVPADAAFVHIHGGDAMAAVTVQPRRAGAVTVTNRLQQETGADLTATAMTLAFDMDGARKITRAANRLPDGTWQVNDLELPAAGIWTVRVILSTEGGQPIELDAPIVIEP